MGVGKHGQSSQRPFVRPRTARVEILQNSGKLTIHKGRFFGRKSSKLKTCSRGSVNSGKKGSVNRDEILYVESLKRSHGIGGRYVRIGTW